MTHITFVTLVGEEGETPEFVRRTLCGVLVALEARDRELGAPGGSVPPAPVGMERCTACERFYGIELRVVAAFGEAAERLVDETTRVGYETLLHSLMRMLRWSLWRPSPLSLGGSTVRLAVYVGEVVVRVGATERRAPIEGLAAGAWASPRAVGRSTR